MYYANEKIWFYVFNGESKGPISEKELLALIEAGHLKRDTLVWKQGFQNWMPFSKSGIVNQEQEEIVSSPYEIYNGSGNKVTNFWIIFLLFVPIISSFFQYLIAGWFQVRADRLLCIPVALNLLCCSLDYYNVKKSGYDANKLNVAFILLIPLYIYKRMSLVNGKKWLFTIIWTVVFVIDLFLPSEAMIKMVNMSNPAVITSVKEGSFYSYPDTTVGEIFDKGLDNCKWNTYMGENREIFVQVTGTLRIEGDESEPDVVGELDTVFELALDSSYEITSMKIEGDSFSDDEINNILAYLYELQKGGI